jgi:type II secretory ATPase GspE/PulE/Tfp pilus assembly ATPase PilB-like protein
VDATETLRAAVSAGAAAGELRAIAAADGMRPLAADGWAKAARGITTVDEVLRVIDE